MVYGSIADILMQWDALGVFDYILPFLLVFAVIFGILSATHILGENKGIAIIIAFVLGLMSLQYRGLYTDFLQVIAPRLGIGLTILLSLMILIGLFIAQEETRYWFYGLGAIGVLIAIIIFYQSAQDMGWMWAGGYGSDGVGLIVLGVFVIGIIVAVAVSGGSKKERSAGTFGPLRAGGH
jgi:hypothetical protein